MVKETGVGGGHKKYAVVLARCVLERWNVINASQTKKKKKKKIHHIPDLEDKPGRVAAAVARCIDWLERKEI